MLGELQVADEENRASEEHHDEWIGVSKVGTVGDMANGQRSM